MKFIPLHYADKLLTVNPEGFVGVVTLWSRPRKVLEVFREQGLIREFSDSPVAVLGTLYGNGLPHLLRNLLYNPQIRRLLVYGRNRSASLKELVRFFTHGVEPTEFLGVKAHRIRGTQALLDDLLHPALFSSPPEIQWMGPTSSPECLPKLKAYFRDLLPAGSERFVESDRQRIPIQEPPISHYPSCVLQHSILENRPLDAWKEVVFKLVRFGVRVELRKGVRKELQNLKAVILDPSPDPEDVLRKFGFSPEELSRYQDDIMDSDLPPLLEYTYGHRLRTYFGVDALQKAAERLREDPESRHQFISLWDTVGDFRDRTANPCLVTVFFRCSEGRLNLTATYRTHNAIDAWLTNVYGLIRILDFVCARSSLPKGALSVISHSISLDPGNAMKYRKALAVAGTRKHRLRTDPYGYFRITVEDGCVVVRHYSNTFLLKEYRSRHAESLQHQLAVDEAVSDVNHALYLGRRLALAERAAKRGEPFEES